MPASTATRPRLISSGAPNPRSSRRSPYESSARTARASSMSGTSVAGGNASTCARSSGVAGIPDSAVSLGSRSPVHSRGVTPRSASNSASSSSRTEVSSAGAAAWAWPGETPPSSSGSVRRRR